MCAVSAVTDYYREKWPMPPSPYTWPYVPGFDPVRPLELVAPYPITITREQWEEYQELKRRMEAYDARTGQPDCIKPEVAEWEAVMSNIVEEQNV